MPVLEAMACGCAVVATDCGGTKDIITDGQNGFLTQVGDVDGIVKRVLLLLDDAGLRRQLVDNASQTLKRFEWGKSIEALERALHSLGNDGLGT